KSSNSSVSTSNFVPSPGNTGRLVGRHDGLMDEQPPSTDMRNRNANAFRIRMLSQLRSAPLPQVQVDRKLVAGGFPGSGEFVGARGVAGSIVELHVDIGDVDGPLAAGRAEADADGKRLAVRIG